MTVTLAEVGTVIAIVIGLLSLYTAAVTNARTMGKMEVKVDTLWDFQMRRAATEAVRKGIATRNSPVVIHDEAKKWMAPLLGPIHDFYRRLGRNMTERELWVEIERRFGAQISEEVCIPHGLDQGACLLIAIQAAQDAMRGQ